MSFWLVKGFWIMDLVIENFCGYDFPDGLVGEFLRNFWVVVDVGSEGVELCFELG